MHPWSVMGYYPSSHSEETFYEHAGHLLLFLSVVFVFAACGWAIANVLDLRPSYQSMGLAAGSLAGISIGACVFLS